jgi:NADH-quinone oxidoreductase subunit J
MMIFSILFYILAVLILVSTALAITRRNLVHAVIYLIFSFFGSAMLFYLFGAPLLAALEVIIYAGAIMILFLFIVMMLKVDSSEEPLFPRRQWLPAAAFGLIYLIVGVLMLASDPGYSVPLEAAVATPREFGRYLFERHWLSIEIVSLLLLVVLLGALHVGRSRRETKFTKAEDKA